MGVLPAFNSRSHANVISGNSTAYLDNIAIALPLGIGLCSLSLLTFLGNAMVVHAIRTERKLHTVSNMFILSLAIADLTVGLIVMPISSVYVLLGDWILGLLVCQLWLVIDYTASTASIFNLLILSLDRYWSIRSPLKYLCKRTKKRALGMIGIVWLISVLWAIPIIGWHLWYNNGVRKHPDNVCETEFNDSVLFKLTTSAANFFIPMVLMVVIYYKIFCEIKRRGKIDIGRSLSVSCANHTRNLSKSSQRKQRKLFDRTNYLRSSCASCSSWSSKQMAQIAGNTKEQTTESDRERDSMARNSLIERERDNRDGRSSSELECDKPKCQQLEDEERVVCKELSSGASNNSTTGEQVKHYQQLTLMSVKPEKPIYALEDYHGVKVEVEYINGGSTLNVINSSSSSAKPNSSTFNDNLNTTSIGKQSDSKRDNTSGKTKSKTKNKKKNLNKSSNTSSKCLEDNSCKWSLRKSSKKVKCLEPNYERRTSRPSIALPANEFCNECQCTAAAAVAATHHQNALRREESSRLRQEKKAARQLGVILGAFILCWMPYIITFIVTAYCTNCVSSTVHQVAIWLGYVNSFLNPFLYALCNENFKQAFKKLLGRVKPQQPSYNFDLTHGTSFRCQKNNFS